MPWQPPASDRIETAAAGWVPPAADKMGGAPPGGVPRETQPSMFSLEAVKDTLLPPPPPLVTPIHYRPGETMGQMMRENAGPTVASAFGINVPQSAETAANVALSLGPGHLGEGGAVKPPPAQLTENQARAAISKQFAKGVQGGSPTASDVLTEIKRAKAEGQPLALADVNNPPLGALAGSTYRQGGAASSVMKGFVEGRGGKAAVKRTSDIIKRHLSDEAYSATASRLKDVRSARARPFWNAAANVGPIWSDRLGELLDHPDVQQGIRRGYAIERRNALGRGEPFNPHEYAVTGSDEAGDPVFGKIPTMKLMMVAKEGLDAIIDSSEMRNEFGGLSKTGVSFANLRDGLVNELDRLNPAYKQAREVWAGDTATMAALRDGRDFLSPKKFSPEELSDRVANMSDSERQFFIVGVADALKSKLFRSSDVPAGTRGVINTEDARMRLRPLFGSDEEAQTFIDAMERERLMTQTGGRIYGGSPTAEREGADNTHEAVLHAAHGVVRLLEGRFLSAAASAVRTRRLFGGKPNPELSEAIARALTDPDIGLSEVGPLLPPKPLPAKQVAPPKGAASPYLYFRAAAGADNSPVSEVTRRPTLPAVQ